MKLEQGTFPSSQDTNLCQASKLTDLGPGCCGSISTITKICLPSTLASFGFTSELHNKLQEHCHAMSGLATAPIAGSEAPLANY
nr:hypothetical protein CFP56_42879 [Quercus suber]